MDDPTNLIAPLAHWLAVGKLDVRLVLPAIHKLAGEGRKPASLLMVLAGLEGETDETLVNLAGHLRDVLRREALRLYEKRKQRELISDEDSVLLQGLSFDPAPEWNWPGDPGAATESVIRSARELALLAGSEQKAPQLFREVKQRLSQNLVAARSTIAPLVIQLSSLLKELDEAWPANLPGRIETLNELRKQRQTAWEAPLQKASQLTSFPGSPESLPEKSSPSPPLEARDAGSELSGNLQTRSKIEPDEPMLLAALGEKFAAANNQDERAQILDLICSWPTPANLEVLREMNGETWAQDRAILDLTLRFGHAASSRWVDWLDWLSGQARLWQSEEVIFSKLIQTHPAALLLVLYSQVPNADQAVVDSLVSIVAQSSAPLSIEQLIGSWSKSIPINERRALLGIPEPAPPPIPPIISSVPPPLPTAQPQPSAAVRAPSDAAVFPKVESAHAAPVPPAPPRKPSLWEQHIQPLFVENWYIVAGILMVILGSSLLAYYTWDKHWLIRYTIMPALLAVFTWSLAGAGRWIEKKGSEFKTTAAILRGAAIGLLPINFMAMALLSADEKVPQKGPALLAMAAIYLSVFGWGLRRWCAAVDPSLRNLLAGSLLLLNALVAIGPLARTVGHFQEHEVLLCLGAGFYFGFVVTAWTIMRFSQKILTREMAEEKRVPWFVAAALAATYLQVFIWVHGFMRHLPQAHTYALLVILIGWLVLYAERRALQLQESPKLHGGESFLGFAFILLGLLMGFTHPKIRIVSFATAGAIWLYQAFSRKHRLHYWIGLTLLALGGASVGLLPQYPGPWLPLLGIMLALAFEVGDPVSRKLNQEDLAEACRGMEAVALVVTTIVAPLTQWHYRSQPLATAGWLLLVGALFACRALKDRKLHWLHATMLVMALLLPYAGFMDMAGRTAHHNTMAFGLALLSWLWLALTRFAERRAPALRDPTATAPPSAWDLLLSSRSTVLLFYGILALAAMLLRVALGDVTSTPLWYRDYMDYAGPILMTLALIPATYYSRSLVPAGIAVVVMAVLFPELRANLQQSIPWLSWGTGLGSASWSLALVCLCFVLRRWPFLKNLPAGDRFIGEEPFPLQRRDHTLFTWPILLAVLFLIIKVDSWNLLRNLSATGVPLKTAIALGFTGVTWTFLAIYQREREGAVFGVHLGWFWALAGIGLGYWQEATEPSWSWPFLMMGFLLQALYWFYRFHLEPTHTWARVLLTEQTRRVLLAGSALLSIACILFLLDGQPLEKMCWLSWFVAAQLIWHGLATRQKFLGTLLFFQIWIGLLAVSAPGSSGLLDRLSFARSLNPTLWLLLGVQLLLLLLERTSGLSKLQTTPTEPGHSASLSSPSPPLEERAGERSPFKQQLVGPLYDRLAPLVIPWFAVSGALALLLGLAAIADGLHWFGITPMQNGLLVILLLLTARAHVSGAVLLEAIFLAYVSIHRSGLAALNSPEAQFQLLAMPSRLALLGLSMVLFTQGIRWLRRRKPELVAGPFAMRFFMAPSSGWIFWPATILCLLAALYHTFDPALRESAPQLWAPYLGTVTFALVALFWQQSGFFAGAALLLLLGNIHLVRVFFGEFLRSHGVSELHLVCLGIGLTLLQSSVLRRTIRSLKSITAINLAGLGLACSILVLLSANYFTEPNLAAITSTRFVVSGLLAFLAGMYFRRAARHPGLGEEMHVDLCEAFYHFGLVLAIWCAALLVPWFRQPLFTLIALGLPVVHFYLRAEFGMRAGLAESRRYRNSAAVLGFVVLGLYVFKAVFHVVLFPGTPIGTQYYHYNSPLIMVLGLILLRLHGLGGTSWLAFYGGLALMTGTYFLLTWIPGFSPFDFPIPSAWCALGLAHFWILLSHARSPARTFIERVAKLGDPSWHSLRRSWSKCLLVASQAATLWGLTDYSSNTYLVAPLVAAAATILIHVGVIRLRADKAALSLSEADKLKAARFSPAVLYLVAAGFELAIALHMDFLTPSYLPKDQIIWAILLLWIGLLATHQFVRPKIQPEVVGRIAFALAALSLMHVVYHRPWSNPGLWGAVGVAMLAALNPLRNRQAANTAEQFCAALLLLIPTWLVYFSQAPFENSGTDAALQAWPVITTATTIFLTGVFARMFPVYLAPGYYRWRRSQFRLFDATLTWLESGSVSARSFYVALWLSLFIAIAAQLVHYQTPFTEREFVLLILLEAALAVAWFFVGKGRNSMVDYYLMQFSAIACFASIRRHLMLTTGFWNYEYDVWASLAFSFGLAGAKQAFNLQQRALRVPLLSTMCALPVVALVWVLVHGLGVNMALLVVGMHSVMFAYLGKDDRESPYNIVALGGFVAFILVTFYSKLHLRAVHAYIIPVGLGVLLLQELFRQRTKPDSRNWIRLVTLMSMLGSSGYYALADPRHAIAFNLTMIVLCLLAMGLGSFFRIRLYLAMGFAGLLVDLVSILYKVLVAMERSARMTVIGSLVLVIGALLVFGAIYYKTKKALLDVWLDKWRAKLGQWE